MSVKLAEGVVEVTADVSRVPGQVASSLSAADPTIAAAGGRSGKSFVGGLAAAAAVAGVFAIGVGLGGAISDGVRQGFNFTVEGIGLASDLSETRAAIGQVFDGSAGAVESFAARANTALGQTQQQALDGAKTFGIFGSSAGLSGQGLADFSTDFVTLASDLASFNNTTPEAAITAIGAALRGEAEPIRAYGVLLDDATLRARALKEGLIETTDQALTPQQRVLAAQAEIYAQTSTQQGDFSRTSDGLANQQRILAASFEEAQTKLGTALLPTITELAIFANDELVPILNEVIDEIGPTLSSAIKETAPAFLDLVREVAPLVPQLVELGVSALPGIIATTEALLPLLIDWAASTSSLFGYVSDFFALLNGDVSLIELTSRAGDAGGAVGLLLKGVFTFARDAGAAFGSFLFRVRETIGGAVATITALPGQAVAAVGRVGSTLYSSGRALVQGFIDGVRSMLAAVGATFGGLMDFVGGFFPNSPAKRGPFSGSGWGNLAKSGGALFDQFRSGMSGEIELSATLAGRPVGSFGAPEAFAAPSGFGAQRQAPSIVIEKVILDATNVRQLSDLVDLFAALPQVARATAPSMGG